MNKIVFIILYFIPSLHFAQITDDFSDGDFINNPSWGGDVFEFIVNTNSQLQSNGPAANATLHLSTTNNFATNCEWRFWVRCAFNPSTTNLARIYLISNQADLEGSLNGYYIQIGGVTGNVDAVDLFRQDGTTRTKIISGIAGHAGANDNTLGIRVIRDASGNWELYSDISGGTNYQLEGSTFDNTYSTSAFMGVVCIHTATRNTSFYFDDFYAGPIIVDTTPPSVVNLQVIDANTLRVVFSEGVTTLTAHNTSNYSANNGLGNPTSATLIHPTTAELVFTTAFTDGLTNTLTVQNIADYANNIMPSPQNENFTYYAPAMAVEYDVIFNELMVDPDPVVALPNQEFIEIYNRSNKTLNLQNWTLSDLTSTVTLPNFSLPPNSYLILCSNANVPLFSSYGPTLGLSAMPSLNNSSDILTLKNQNGELIDAVAYFVSWYKDALKKNGGWTLERISYHNLCRDSANWAASSHPNGGTPGTINSIYNQFTDILPPQLLSASLQNPYTIVLNFNESIDSIDALPLSKYFINNGIGNPQSLQIVNNLTTIILSFTNPLQPSTIYELTVSNIKDCIGNVNNSFTVTLGIPEPAIINDVVINEFMADPDPVVALPNQEFVELFNTSNKIIDLTGWKFSDGSSTVTLPAFLLLPNHFVLLTSTSNVSLFTAYGNVIGVSSLPSLNNSGDNLALYDAYDNLISQVNYKDSWYQDIIKKSGGWTLERIDPYNPCNDSANWRASTDPRGGTPNQQNSIFGQILDVSPPAILNAFIELPSTIYVTFNETFEPSLWNLSDFDLQGFGNPFSYSTLDNPTLQLNFSFVFAPNTIYTLNIQKVKDCIGNLGTNLNIQIGVPSPANFNDIIINEIMADPDPVVGLPEAEYIEIYNRSNKIIDISDWTLSDNLSNGKIPQNTIILPNSYWILCSSSSLNELKYFGNSVALTNFPGLNNSGELITLKDKNGNLIDFVNYKDTWYREDTKKNGGWALERMDPQACFVEENWKASIDPAGGTPGKINSTYETILDTNPPNIHDLILINKTTLKVIFNERMNETDLSNIQLYDLQPNIGHPAQAIPNFEQNQAELIFPFELDSNQVYTLSIHNIKDCTGNVASSLMKVFAVPVTAKVGDIILNEILYEPRTGGKRYIEIYNKTNQWLNIGQWKIGRANELDEVYQTVSLPDYIVLPPYGYMAFTQDTQNVKQEYNPPAHAVLVQLKNNIPAFDSKTDKVVLLNLNEERIDEVRYSSDWHYADLVTRKGVALERLNPDEPSQSESNWFSASSLMRFGTPGYKNSQSYRPDIQDKTFYVDPKVFSPDFDGFEDVLALHYAFSQNDNNVRITIFDSEGRIVKILKNNILVSNEPGYFLWDGTDDSGRVVQIGTYIAILEVVNIHSGEKKSHKAAFVVAKKQ